MLCIVQNSSPIRLPKDQGGTAMRVRDHQIAKKAMVIKHVLSVINGRNILWVQMLWYKHHDIETWEERTSRWVCH